MIIVTERYVCNFTAQFYSSWQAGMSLKDMKYLPFNFNARNRDVLKWFICRHQSQNSQHTDLQRAVFLMCFLAYEKNLRLALESKHRNRLGSKFPPSPPFKKGLRRRLFPSRRVARFSLLRCTKTGTNTYTKWSQNMPGRRGLGT
jgi:hypothetical protein